MKYTTLLIVSASLLFFGCGEDSHNDNIAPSFSENPVTRQKESQDLIDKDEPLHIVEHAPEREGLQKREGLQNSSHEDILENIQKRSESHNNVIDLMNKAKKESDLKKPLKYSISPERSNGISLKYETYYELYKEEELRAKNELNEPDYSLIPEGGYLAIYIERSTIGAANTEWFLAIVTDSEGNEIIRQRGKDDIPNVPSGLSDNWWNHLIVYIPTQIKEDFNVRVVDRLGNEASDFKVKILHEEKNSINIEEPVGNEGLTNTPSKKEQPGSVDKIELIKLIDIMRKNAWNDEDYNQNIRNKVSDSIDKRLETFKSSDSIELIAILEELKNCNDLYRQKGASSDLRDNLKSLREKVETNFP